MVIIIYFRRRINMSKKKTILDFYQMKKNGEKVSWVTAYDFPMASFAEQAGIDMILVEIGRAHV